MQTLRQAAPPQPAANGRQGRLLRGYLHKTSNSLCGIKGYAALIAGDGPGTGTSAEWARRIIREIERLEDVFREVGDLSNAAPAPAATGRTPDLATIVAETVAEADARHPGLNLVCGAIPAAAPSLPAADLRLVLREVLDNAAEGCRGHDGAANVDLRATLLPTGRVALRIVDDGPGMAPELTAQSSDPFVTTKEGHSGVGLTRVETLMDMYGLAWHLASEAGSGTAATLEVGRRPEPENRQS